MNTGYFLPIDTSGFQSFTQDTETAGWYQLDMLAETVILDVLPVTVPATATGLWLQAISDINYCFSPSVAADGANFYMTLPAGSYMFFPGRDAIQSLCILLGESGAEFRVQFENGAVGPTSWIHVPGGGGAPGPPGPPGPPGELSELVTQNTIHVMKNGNDGTGERNRLDLPFLTIAAAAAVLEEGDTLHVWAGTYEEGNIYLPVSCTLELHGANIDVPGVGIAFGIQYGGESLSIRGSGRITHVGDSGSVPLIVAENEDTRLYIDIDQLRNDMGTLISSPGGLGNRLFVKAEMLATNNSNTAVAISGFSYMRIDGHLDTFGEGRAILINNSGTLDLYAGVDSASVTTGNVGTVAINGATGNLYGYITAASMAVSCTSGIVNNYGAVTGYGTEPVFFVNTSTGCTIYGSVTSQDVTAVVIRESQCDIYGSLYSQSAFALNIIRPGSLVRLHGSARNVDTEPAISLAADTTLYVYGDVFSQEQAAIDLGTWIDNAFGALYIYGTVRSAENIAVLMGDGNLFHYGRITSDVGYAIGTTATSVGGRMRLAGLVETLASQGPIICATGTHVIDLMANARLQGAGTYTIEYTGGTASVNSYLASGTQDIDPAIAINGSFNVIL